MKNRKSGSRQKKDPKPLQGVAIIVTRPRAQARGLFEPLRKLGAKVIAAPAIRIEEPRSWKPLDRAIARLRFNDAVIFTSANTVERFFGRARKILGENPMAPPHIYAIGPLTAQALRTRGWRGVDVPDHFEGEALARRIRPKPGWKILLPRARRARNELPRALRRRGASVEIVEAYQTMGDRSGLARIRKAVVEGGTRYVTFTSSSTAEHVVHALGRSRARRFFKTATAASIGPITSTTLQNFGVRNIIEAKPCTSEGIVRAILRHHAREGRPHARH